MLQMKGITKAFSGNVVLREVQFDLEAGEIHALMGENGAGKSTMMKVLTGIHPKDGGTIHWKGKEVTFKSPQQAEEAGIAVIHQELNILPYLSIAENLFLGKEETLGKTGILKTKKMETEAKERLAALGLHVDPAAEAAAVESANAADIPVITLDRSAEGGEVVAHVASDNVAGGKMAGEYLVSLIGEGAQVAELEGVPGSSAARERGEGFNSVATEQLDVVAKQTANFNRAEGLSVMENILQSNPDIKGVFAHNDEMALGALEAIEAAGKDIVVVGFDATDDAVASVEDGRLAGTIAQQPAMIGEIGIETAMKVLAGEEVEASIPVELELVGQE